MKANEFKTWCARVGLSQRQIADRLGVTRQTIHDWESAVSPIPQVMNMSCATWEARLEQEGPNLGPVTLVYSDQAWSREASVSEMLQRCRNLVDEGRLQPRYGTQTSQTPLPGRGENPRSVGTNSRSPPQAAVVGPAMGNISLFRVPEGRPITAVTEPPSFRQQPLLEIRPLDGEIRREYGGRNCSDPSLLISVFLTCADPSGATVMSFHLSARSSLR
jgi:hypothetical protein